MEVAILPYLSTVTNVNGTTDAHDTACYVYKPMCLAFMSTGFLVSLALLIMSTEVLVRLVQLLCPYDR